MSTHKQKNANTNKSYENMQTHKNASGIKIQVADNQMDLCNFT